MNLGCDRCDENKNTQSPVPISATKSLCPLRAATQPAGLSFHHLYPCPCEEFSPAAPRTALTCTTARPSDLCLHPGRKQDKADARFESPQLIQAVVCDQGLQA